MNIATIIDNLQLPVDSRIDKRVPKKLLSEQGAPTASDRKKIQNGVDEVLWLAALKPTNIAVPSYKDEHREYLEVAVLSATFKDKANVSRLTELIHRAVPYPVLLLTTATDGITLSLAHKRNSQGAAGEVVLESGIVSVTISDTDELNNAFITSISVSEQPRTNLYNMYQGWIDSVQALLASRITGKFTLPSTGVTGSRSEGLTEHARLLKELSVLRSRAEKEKQTNKLVELNLDIQRLMKQIDSLKLEL